MSFDTSVHASFHYGAKIKRVRLDIREDIHLFVFTVRSTQHEIRDHR